MAIKLTSYDRTFIPNITFPTSDGDIDNRELLPSEQVSCKVALCSATEREIYYSDVDTLVRDKCKEVKGLESFGVTDGKTLVDEADKYIELSRICTRIYEKSMGLHEDDNNPQKRHLSDGGEFTEKEL